MNERTCIQYDREAFASNMRVVVGQFPSVTAASRHLGINRQQLNKYLNGSSYPNLTTVQRVAQYLNLDPLDLLLDEKSLAARLQSEGQRNVRARLNRVGAAVIDQIAASARALNHLAGDYIEYTHSPGNPTQILAGLSRIFNNNGMMFQKSISLYNRRNGLGFRAVKHEAVLFQVGGLVHFTSVTNLSSVSGRFGLKIINPTFGDGERYLRGVQLSTEIVKAGRNGPFPVLMKRIAVGDLLTTLRQSCGPFALNHPELDPVVVDAFQPETRHSNSF